MLPKFRFQKKSSSHEIATPQQVGMAALSPNLAPFDDQPLYREIRSGRWALHGSAFLMAGSVVAVVSLFCYLIAYRNEILNQDVHVYFDIKAIDGAGHPVSGADVRRDRETLGVTDSFGEWRSYLTLKSRSSFVLTMHKSLQGGTISVSKNFVIPGQMARPFNDPGDVVIKQTIAMLGSENNVERSGEKQIADSQVEATMAVVKAESEPVEQAAQPGVAIEVYVPKGTPDSIVKLLAQLKAATQQRFETAGIPANNSASFKVRLAGMRGASQLISIEAAGPQIAKNSFLRNVVGDVGAMSEQIYTLVTSKSAVAGLKSRAGWRQYRTALQGAGAENAQLFAVGFAAERVGRGEFIYWAPSNGEINFTVVGQERVMARRRLRPADAKAINIAPIRLARAPIPARAG